MFNFMKKGAYERDREKIDRDEKEKRKKDKKSRKDGKQNVSGSNTMSTEELLRLDEIRRSLKIRGRRKEKPKLPSGITADYSADFFANLDLDRGVENDRGNDEILANTNTTIDQYDSKRSERRATNHSDSSETSLRSSSDSKIRILPPVPPKPPKRGILKTSRNSLTASEDQTDESVLLLQNTMKNELITFESFPVHHNNNGKVLSPASLQVITSPSADSLTDTTNSSFATPPFSLSPVGEGSGCNLQKFEDISLPLPKIKLIPLPAARELTIRRQNSPRNDFGFSLRKAICLDRNESLWSPQLKSVIFAEPGTGSGTGLLPGDKLLKVNDICVEDMAREKIIDMIRSSGDEIKVVVQPVSELVELSRRCMPSPTMSISDEQLNDTNCNTLRRSASKRLRTSEIRKYCANSDEGIQENVWLIHRGGYCAAIILPQSDETDKVTIKLLHNDEQMLVDEDDIEKSNPSGLDYTEDICNLKHFNEASVLHVLRMRYGSNLIHTKAGPTLMVVNPMIPLSLYSDKVVSMFRGCKTEDMPPHIYSLAQTAYRSMIETRRDQSLIFIGRSGSGKTTSFKHALYYLTLAAGSVNKILTAEKVNAINVILEAFGNVKTCLNSNATRFSQILTLNFDHSGSIVSLAIELLLLEKTRVCRRHDKNDHTFHVLNRLLAGAEGSLQKSLHLDTLASVNDNPYISLSSKLDERHKAASDFLRLTHAFQTLNIDDNSVKAIWSVIAGILHLGSAGAVRSNTGLNKFQFAHPESARKAASLLGTSIDVLAEVAFQSNVSNGTVSSPTRSPNENSVEAALDGLDAMSMGLYSEVFNSVITLINRAMHSSAHSIASILLLDTPGFQNPACGGKQSGATIADLRHNYLQERLQLLYHHVNLVAPKECYAQEFIEIETEKDPFDLGPGSLISVIDKAPQSHIIRTSQRDLREQDRRGLFWLLDEESMYPNSNDDTFFEGMFNHYGDREYQRLIRRTPANHQFVLHHMQGTNPVLYSTQGWIKASREHLAVRGAIRILQDSTKDDISKIFVNALGSRGGLTVAFSGSIVGIDGTQSLRRVSSIRRSYNSAGLKRNSIMLQTKFITDGIIDTLRRSGTHFVQCYLLQHNAGIVNNNSTKNLTTEDIVNIPLMRSQIRGSQVLEAARLYRLGFPETIPINEFIRRFGLLCQCNEGEITPDLILASNDIDPTMYRIGPSQVLLKSGILNQLEAKRDECISARIIQLQAFSRGYLARRRLAKRRVQELAVRCLQRNVRAFLNVRDWPWWRLLVRVTPLLNVHRTEEQLKIASNELASLKSKLEKIEADKSQLKEENERLEAKLSEMTIDLSEERSAANLASERLEIETAERLKLENEMSLQQSKIQSLQESTEKLELELICAKSDFNGSLDDEDADGDDGNSVYKAKYQRVARELEFTKRRLQTQHEHDLEQLVGLKKQLEKKLNDAYEEVEEQRQVVAQWKRKHQKMSNEMNDLRMLLDQQNSRNNVLEKRQRKFDSDTQALQETARQERQAKERVTREKDVLIAEKFSLEQQLADARLELELKEEKLNNLKSDLEEMTFTGGTEEEVAQLKRSKLEMERKCKELEEELDDMAGQVQLLEQSKLRLEMTLETMRKEAKREGQQRDEEMEECRSSAYKKIKALECQLEAEHEERSLLLREKHELERRVQFLDDQQRNEKVNEESMVQKLKRDLRKCKALLKDSQAQLDRAKNETSGKNVIRQLRNQLEDAEMARSSAVKARQSAENELVELTTQLDEVSRSKKDAEEKAMYATREKTELQAQIEENEEETAELMKKYTAAVKQLNTEHSTISEYEIRIGELESEKQSLKDQINELHNRLQTVENVSDSSSSVNTKRLEMRNRELESRLELEQTSKSRLEAQINRHKDAIEKLETEISMLRAKEMTTQEQYRKSQKSTREIREELQRISNKEQEGLMKRKELERQLEEGMAESTSLRNDLRLALQRIADLQQAMEQADEDDEDPSASDSDSSDESINGISTLDTYDRKSMLSPISNGSIDVEENGTNPKIQITSP